MAAYMDEEEVFKCPQHPSKRRRNGICPTCLRDRLITLCPDCANVRPCACCPATTTSSSSSSSSSTFSFFSSASSSRRGGRVSDLLDKESAFRRSRSVGVPFLFTRFAREKQAENSPARKKSRTAALLAKFGLNSSKSKKREEFEENKENENSKVAAAAAPAPAEQKFANSCNSDGNNECRQSCSNASIEEFANMMMRSRSVSVGMMNHSGERRHSSASASGKGKGWSFPSPMKVFRPKTPKVANDRSPMCRG
nr:uncharacterized protein DDB_G0271670-like [Coffea arabica]